MPTYKYAPLSTDQSGGIDEEAPRAFEGDPFAKKRDMCVGL